MGRTFAALLAAAAVLLLTAATPAMAKSSTSRCQDVTAIGNAFVARSVQAHSTPCKNVRGKLHGWLRKGSQLLPKKAGSSWRCKRLRGPAKKWSCVKRRSRAGVTFKIAPERVAPNVALFRPAQGATYEQGASVAASYSCWDNAAIGSCVGTVPNIGRIPTSQLGSHGFDVTATDKSGNRTTRHVTYTVVARKVSTPSSPPPSSGGSNPPPPAADTQGPDISVSSPTADQEFAWGASAIAGYSCADASGVTECTGTANNTPIGNGAPLSTNGAPGPGKRTLTIMAKDGRGNVSTKSVDYTVKPAGYYALTYDDGPNDLFTQPVLNALASVNAKATFFVIGSQVQLFPSLTQAEVAGGHYLQNHTMTHTNIGPNDPNASTVFGDPNWVPPHGYNAQNQQKDVTAELSDTSALIAQYTGGQRPTFVRPPYGMWDATTVSVAASLGMEVAAWTTDTNDWMDSDGVDQVVNNAMSVPSGGIILMHDVSQKVVDATPRIVTRLRDERGMLPGKLAHTATAQHIVGWEDAGEYFVNAVAP